MCESLKGEPTKCDFICMILKKNRLGGCELHVYCNISEVGGKESNTNQIYSRVRYLTGDSPDIQYKEVRHKDRDRIY